MDIEQKPPSPPMQDEQEIQPIDDDNHPIDQAYEAIEEAGQPLMDETAGELPQATPHQQAVYREEELPHVYRVYLADPYVAGYHFGPPDPTKPVVVTCQSIQFIQYAMPIYYPAFYTGASYMVPVYRLANQHSAPLEVLPGYTERDLPSPLSTHRGVPVNYDDFSDSDNEQEAARLLDENLAKNLYDISDEVEDLEPEDDHQEQ